MNKSPYEIYKPTRMQVIVPIVVLVITLVAGGIMLLISKKLGVEHEKINYLAPGRNEIQLEAGKYTLYLLTEADYEGKHYSIPEDFEKVTFKVLHNEEELPLEKAEYEYSFGEGDYKGKTVKEFEVVEEGTYTLETTVENEEKPEVVVAVGKKDENLQAVVTLTVIAMMIMLMGTLQFIGYMLLNGGKMLYYLHKKKMEA